MKYFRVIVFISLKVLLLLLSLGIFSNMGEVSDYLQKTDLQNQALPAFQYIALLQILLVVVPLVVLLVLTFYEISQIAAARKLARIAQLQAQQAQQQEASAEQEEDLTEKYLKQEEADKQKQLKLQSCIESQLRKKQSSDKNKTAEKLLSCISQVFEITQGEVFFKETQQEQDILKLSATYAFFIPEEKVYEFQWGEGLIGQVAKAGKSLYLDEIPQGYITVKSGLGSATPSYLLICPMKNKQDQTYGIIELASFKPFSHNDILIIESLGLSMEDMLDKTIRPENTPDNAAN